MRLRTKMTMWGAALVGVVSVIVGFNLSPAQGAGPVPGDAQFFFVLAFVCLVVVAWIIASYLIRPFEQAVRSLKESLLTREHTAALLAEGLSRAPTDGEIDHALEIMKHHRDVAWATIGVTAGGILLLQYLNA